MIRRFLHDLRSWVGSQLRHSEESRGLPDDGGKQRRFRLLASLKECINTRDLNRGKSIHESATQTGDASNMFVASSLIDMYAKCGSIENARKVFDLMPERDVVSWNAMLFAYADSGQPETVLELFDAMSSPPSSRSFVAAFKACTLLALKESPRKLNGEFVKQDTLYLGNKLLSQAKGAGYDTVDFVSNALIDMYSSCGSLADAHRIFCQMSMPNIVSWNTMIMGHIDNGHPEAGLRTFRQMLHTGSSIPNSRSFVAAIKACTALATQDEAIRQGASGRRIIKKKLRLETGRSIHAAAVSLGFDSDRYVVNCLIDMYSRCGSLENARAVFHNMKPHCRNVISWTSLMHACLENGEPESALYMYSGMRAEVGLPDAPAFVAALKACGMVVALEKGRQIHEDTRSCGLEDVPNVANSLVDFYGRCGSMKEARDAFDHVKNKDIVTWTSLMSGYSRHQGSTSEVFELFDSMCDSGVKPDGIAFVCVLTACSHAGLVEKGNHFFTKMPSYGITPEIEHYHCIVDMLGRANRIEEAVAVVERMPFEPNQITWTTILGACRKWRNATLGRRVFDALVKLQGDEGHITAYAYVLMQNIYGSVGMFEEQSRLETVRRDLWMWKQPGESWWSDEHGVVHKFIAGDTKHPQVQEIQERLKEVMVETKESGHVNLSDEERHSERLAIGCALLNTKPGEMIRISKNLRMCEDCHRATAVLSKLEGRRIVCRDSSRFHVFEDGECSCGDFW